MNEELIYQVLETVGEIPKGCVATYKQIACLIGREKNSRLVGKILANASYYGHYPCHRVVNFQGRLVPGWFEQKELLEKEGITFKDNHHPSSTSPITSLTVSREIALITIRTSGFFF